MSRNGRVIVAMSGGVDSSVAACLLRDAGYDCVGVFMRVGVESPTADCATDSGKHGCCSADDALDARAVAGKLGVPFYALNFQPDFDRIINYFVDEYSRARTPNPCVMCNIELKFGKLLRYADMMDAEYVATGHYARVLHRDNDARLARSLNPDKDQSYVLFGIRRENLRRCLFPLGETPDKAVVREAAASLGLAVHDKPDSQEICFVPNNDYRTLLDERRPGLRQPGDIVDADGAVLGRHEGFASYTIGQRRGLSVAAGRPVYVTAIDPQHNTVTLGSRDDLLSDGLIAREVNWLVDPPADEIAVDVKIRHRHAAARARLRALDNGDVEARFETPQTAVTPGQAAVFYADDVVLGGGWIERGVRQ